jgi:deazaflavin-dependent oxidoreductase (nitroreductase family)
MSDAANAMRDFNQRVMAEFRANAGVVGGPFAGAPMLILHSRGAKSGAMRELPLVYQPRGADAWVIFASKAGSPTNPDWYHNLVAHPADVRIEVGTETVSVDVRVLEGAEREEVWAAQKAASAAFAQYEAKTTRTIPVVLLSRRS